MNPTYRYNRDAFGQEWEGRFGTGLPEDEFAELEELEREAQMRRGLRPQGRGMRSRPRPQGRRRDFQSGGAQRRATARQRPDNRASPPDPARRSQRLRRIQDCLSKATGMRIPATGMMSAQMRSALRAFQKKEGLSVSGVADSETRQALKAMCPRPSSGGNKGDAPMGEFETKVPHRSIYSDEPISAEVAEPITRALQAVNPAQPLRADAQRIPRNRRNGIQAIDQALHGLDRIAERIRRHPNLQPIESTGMMLQRFMPVRRNLTAARGHLTAAAPPGSLLDDAAVNARFKAASNLLSQARNQWRAFLIQHRQAVNRAVTQSNSEIDEDPFRTGKEFDLEVKEIRPVTAMLTWLPDNAAPELYQRERAPDGPENVGVYIAVKVDSRDIIKEVLYVGLARDESFYQRLSQNDVHKTMEDDTNLQGLEVKYFLAKIESTNACPVAGCGAIVEHLIARTFIRAGLRLRYYKNPHSIVRAAGPINIKNILPKPFRHYLAYAYHATPKKDRWGQTIPVYSVPNRDKVVPSFVQSSRLLLSHPQEWEIV